MTAPTGKPRGRPKGCAKTGGRIAGKSLDRSARQLVSSELAGSILTTFEQLGGTADMVSWARDNRTVFYTQILSRLMPAPQKDDADVVQNNQINIGNLSETEAAIRVAFALSKAIYPDPSLAPPVRTVERVDTPEPITPQQACDWRNPTPPCTPPAEPEPEDDPARRQWAESLKLTTDQKLVRDTHVESLSSYAGSGPEQGGTVRQPSSRGGKASAAQLCYRLSRRGRDLL